MKKTALIFAMLVGLATAALPAQADGFRFSFYNISDGGHIGSHNPGYSNKQFQHVVKKNKRIAKKRYRQVRPLSPNRITRILYRKGFSSIHNLRTNDRYYKARAYNKRGRLVRLKIDAYNGKIVKRKAVRQWRPAYSSQQDWQFSYYRAPFWQR